MPSHRAQFAPTERWRVVWGSERTWRLWHMLGGVLMLPFGLLVLSGLAVGFCAFVAKLPGSLVALTSKGTSGLADGALGLAAFCVGSLFGGVLLRYGAAMGLDGVLGAKRSTFGVVVERRTVTAINGRRRHELIVDGTLFLVPRIALDAVGEGDTVRLDVARYSGNPLALSIRVEP